MRNRNQKGFTLIELLVVIAIIALLASIVLLALNSARAKSRDAKRVADIRQMSTALELFYNDYGGYPLASGGAPTNMTPNYLGSLPIAPTPNDSTACTGYTYAQTGTGYSSQYNTSILVYPSYTYTFCLGGATGGFPLGLHTASPQGIQ